MSSVVMITLSFVVLSVVHSHLAEQASCNVTIKTVHENDYNFSNNADEFSVSTLIEKANNNIRNMSRGPKVLFGDIAVPTGFQNADPCTARGCKWTKSSDGNVYIPYIIANGFSTRQRSVIVQGLESFSASTCIRFRPRRNERDYIRIRSLSGCFSFLGRRGGPQDVSLNRNGCVFFGIVQHEIIHALGFNHEQTRSDRDQHVRILYENIIRSQEFNFRRIDTNNLRTPYDYNSVMHYGRFAFSRNGQPTIIPIPNNNVAIGRATQMSPNDILRINRLYRCGRKPSVYQKNNIL